MKTTAVFTGVTNGELHAKIKEFNHDNSTMELDWVVKHLIPIMLDSSNFGDRTPVYCYTLVFERSGN